MGADDLGRDPAYGAGVALRVDAVAADHHTRLLVEVVDQRGVAPGAAHTVPGVRHGLCQRHHHSRVGRSRPA
ncbi:hypothetical protein GCM10009562_41970 [Nocardioides aquaticus]